MIIILPISCLLYDNSYGETKTYNETKFEYWNPYMTYTITNNASTYVVKITNAGGYCKEKCPTSASNGFKFKA